MGAQLRPYYQGFLLPAAFPSVHPLPRGKRWHLEEPVGKAFAPRDVQQDGFAEGVLGPFPRQG